MCSLHRHFEQSHVIALMDTNHVGLIIYNENHGNKASEQTKPWEVSCQLRNMRDKWFQCVYYSQLWVF